MARQKSLPLNFDSQAPMTEQAAEELAKTQLQQLRFLIGTSRKTVEISDPALLKVLKQAVLMGAQKGES